MEPLVPISFRGLGPSEEIERACREEAAKLRRFCAQLLSVRVGDRVRFLAEPGVKGPQASHVHLMRAVRSRIA